MDKPRNASSPPVLLIPNGPLVRTQSDCRLHHQPLHLRHGIFPAHEQGLRNNRMANVEFMNARQRCDGLHVVIGQAMSGIHGEADAAAIGHGLADALELDHARSIA